jgi:hypothetical protein
MYGVKERERAMHAVRESEISVSHRIETLNTKYTLNPKP